VVVGVVGVAAFMFHSEFECRFELGHDILRIPPLLVKGGRGGGSPSFLIRRGSGGGSGALLQVE
jgi:hypothetical protein